MEKVGSALNHGAVGNGRILALISDDCNVDWLCLPRFDSPSIFCGLLDREKGGVFSIKPSGDERYRCSMRYINNTNVIATTFESKDDAFEVIDFAPAVQIGGTFQRPPAQLVRLLRPLRGAPRVRIHFEPRPEYGRITPQILPAQRGIIAVGGEQPLYLHANISTPSLAEGRSFVLDREVSLVLTFGVPVFDWSESYASRTLAETVRAWRRWVMHCAIPSVTPREVIRSALALRLHVYDDTGAIIAAATTSIPEARGTQRTWDYRFCWLRDTAFVLRALDRLGQLEESERFLRFLTDLVFVPGRRLQPLYGIGGETQLTERILDHLEGWEGNGPVRVGNDAYTHMQTDVYGETVMILSRLLRDPRLTRPSTECERLFSYISLLAEQALEDAKKVDSGIWEFRSELKHNTFSKVMCWVAAERGATVATELGFVGKAKAWRKSARELKDEILRESWNEKEQMFAQSYGSEHADAANLLMPSVGFIEATHPKFLSTLEAFDRLLVRDGLVLRYTNPDDFGKTTSAFLICSFWRVEALAKAGHIERAMREYEHLISHANPLGLFSEDVEPTTKELLGNFPQAYTHVGIINCATTLSMMLAPTSGDSF